MSFFIEYVLGHKSVSNKKADKGTIVHKVMEILANIKLAKQGNSKFVDEIVGQKGIDVDVDSLTEEVYEYYSKSFSHHQWEAKDLKDCKKWVHKALEFNDGQFDPRTSKIWAVEQHFDMEIPHDWAHYEYDGVSGQLSIKGTIDLIIEVDKDTIEIIDYKTGSYRTDFATGKEKDYKYFKTDPQLLMYYYAAKRMWPSKKIITTIYYINAGGPFTVLFSESDKDTALKMLSEKFEEVKAVETPSVIRTDLKQNWKCRHLCHFGKNTFKGTNIKPLREKRVGRITKVGEVMCMCEQLRYTFKHRPIEAITKHMSKDGHCVSHYHEPGSTNKGDKSEG